MKSITKKDILQNKSFYLNEIKIGKIFIYPTDTIYGIGCDATNKKSVSRIREIKSRDARPFSVIAPSKNWIKKNCKISKEQEQFLKKLPGKYTLIFELKNKSSIAKKQVIGNLKSIGVRIPNNWFSRFLSKIGAVFISTSANISGSPVIKSINELENSMKNQIDYIIDNGILDNFPSTIIDLTNNAKIIR